MLIHATLESVALGRARPRASLRLLEMRAELRRVRLRVLRTSGRVRVASGARRGLRARVLRAPRRVLRRRERRAEPLRLGLRALRAVLGVPVHPFLAELLLEL